MKGAIIVPTRNESARIQACLERLQSLRQHWLLIVVDGGSGDRTPDLAAPLCDHVISTDAGRANQLNAGALKARQCLGIKGLLVFLHADTQLPAGFESVMARFLRTGSAWGRFDVAMDDQAKALRLVAFMMNWRSRLTGIATGDQCLFFRADAFWQLRGFPMLALMEDIEICKQAKRLGKPFCSRDTVITASRKWQREGIVKTILLMWCCRAAYFCGVRAATIHRWYYGNL